MELRFPINGKFLGSPSSAQPKNTSRDLKNVRPLFDGRFVGGQRPGWDKMFTQQIAGVAGPIVAMCSVSIVESP